MLSFISDANADDKADNKVIPEESPMKIEEYCYNSTIIEYDIGSDFLFEDEGTASHYGNKFHNRKTASGELYSKYDLTAAHRRLPFGTILRVTNLETGCKVFVRITDRGPFIRRRILDLSHLAAETIDAYGLTQVKIEGFITNSANLLTDSLENYFYCYSYNHPLVCLPESILNIIDSADMFMDAVEKYETASEEYPSDMIFLIVPADRNFNLQKDYSEGYFKIAVVKKVFQEVKLLRAQIVEE